MSAAKPKTFDSPAKITLSRSEAKSSLVQPVKLMHSPKWNLKTVECPFSYDQMQEFKLRAFGNEDSRDAGQKIQS
jgi:hypothetical protein